MTYFGKQLRIIRLDRNERLYDMAQKLKVTSSYLSAIEMGSKPIPNYLVSRITSVYPLSGNEKRQLQAAADDTVQTVQIDLSELDNKRRNAALLFARRLRSMPEELLNNIADQLANEEG